MNIKSNKQGHCPVCNDLDLIYGFSDFNDIEISYDWKCGTCGAEGHEVYAMEFLTHVLETEDETIDLSTIIIEEEKENE